MSRILPKKVIGDKVGWSRAKESPKRDPFPKGRERQDHRAGSHPPRNSNVPSAWGWSSLPELGSCFSAQSPHISTHLQSCQWSLVGYPEQNRTSGYSALSRMLLKLWGKRKREQSVCGEGGGKDSLWPRRGLVRSSSCSPSQLKETVTHSCVRETTQECPLQRNTLGNGSDWHSLTGSWDSEAPSPGA